MGGNVDFSIASHYDNLLAPVNHSPNKIVSGVQTAVLS